MKKINVVLLLTTLAAITNAQSWQWAKKFGGSLDDKTYTMTSDMNGSVYIAGFYNSPTISFDTITLTNSGNDIFLVKFDYNGNAQWAKSSSGAGIKEVKSVCVDDFGDVFITGFFRDTSITFGTTMLQNNGTSDMFVVKYDQNGNVIWAKNSEYSEAYAYGTDVAADASGNIYAIGYFKGIMHTFGTDTLLNNCTTGGTFDMYIIKYDAAGNQVWARRDGGSQDDFPSSVYVDKNSNEIVMTGEFSSPQILWEWPPFIHIYNHVTSSPYNSDIFLVKYNSIGEVQWAKSEGGTYWDNGRDIITDDLGNIYIAGSFESDSVIFGTYQLNLDVGPDLFLVKFNSIGDVQWAIQGTGTSIDWGVSLLNDASGNVYMSGIFNSPILSLDNLILNNSGTPSNMDFFISKFDDSGNIQWIKTASGVGDEDSYSITMDELGAIYIAGNYSATSDEVYFDTITIPQTSSSNYDIFLAKLDTNLITVIAPLNQVKQISIFPNPFSTSTTLRFDNPYNEEFVLRIYDSNGRLIRNNIKTTGSEILFMRKELKAGIYLIELRNTNEIFREKIIIE